MNLTTMKVKELRTLAGELNIAGRWDMSKSQLIDAIVRVQIINEAKELGIEVNYSLTTKEIKEITEAEKNRLENERLAQETAEIPTETFGTIADPEEEVKPEQPKRKGRTRTIEVYKDGELFNTIEGLMETFKYVTENNITNVGWVKRSLKTGEETKAGYKYKVGGFLFKYTE